MQHARDPVVYVPVSLDCGNIKITQHVVQVSVLKLFKFVTVLEERRKKRGWDMKPKEETVVEQLEAVVEKKKRKGRRRTNCSRKRISSSRKIRSSSSRRRRPFCLWH